MIRLARIGDRAAIVDLITEMGGHDEIRVVTDPLSVLPWMLASPECRVLVADDGERVAGVAMLAARASPLYDRREAWLGVLAVAPGMRSRGIGTALLEAAEAAAAQLGCAAIVLETSVSRERTQAFYGRAGFVERPAARRFERAVDAHAGDLVQRFLAAAARAATHVGEAIAGLGSRAAVGIGADGAPTEAADAAAERAALRELLPLGIPIVSEEAGIVGAAVIDPSLPWISLDPLDGSRNFVNGYPPYATSIGLVQHGRPIAGFAADLGGAGYRWAAAGNAATRDGRPIRTRRGALAAMRSTTAGAPPVRSLPGFARVRMSGSTATELCRVADGALGAFIALDRPGVHVHDLAAAMGIIEAAGGCVIDAAGNVPELTADAARCIEIVAACDRATALALAGLV